MKELKPAERLIVAADFEGDPPGDWRDAYEKTLHLAKLFKGTGITIKVNSVGRAAGHEIINNTHVYRVGVFDDLKLCDTPKTHRLDGLFLAGPWPLMVTVMCASGHSAIRALKAQLLGTQVLGVTVPSTFTEKDCQDVYLGPIDKTVLRLARLGIEAEVDGLVCAPGELLMLRKEFGGFLPLCAVGIRPIWTTIENDDQNPDRVMTPAEAILAGATRIIVGRPITDAEDPYRAAMLVIDEIASVVR